MLKGFTLQTMLPECDSKTDTVNAIVDLTDDVSEVLPFLASVTGVCTYDDRIKVLMLNRGGHRVVIYPRRITITRLNDRQEATRVADELKDLINSTYENKQNVVPCYRKGGEVRVLDVMRLLPGTNCRECGQPTCTAFAAKLARQETVVARCSPLFGGDFEVKKGKLLALLQAAGYEITS